jgi:RNA polymerase sigma factor (sigma-70 family)
MAMTFRTLRGVREAAEDVSQEVFVRLLRYCDFEKFQDANEFERYLSKVAEHAAIDYLSRGRRLIYGEESVEAAGERLFADATPDDVLRAQQLRHKILSELDLAQRNLAELLMRGYTTPEIALQCGWTYGAAAARIHRLRERLRNLLKDKD